MTTAGDTSGPGSPGGAAGYGLEEVPCPHCHGKTRLEPHPSLRWVCGACGGPRVPLDVLGVPRSGDEVRPLARAKSAKDGAVKARGLAALLLTVATIALGAGSLTLAGSVGVGIATFCGALMAMVSALSFRAKGRGLDAEAVSAMDEAWAKVAEELVAARRDLTARDVARAMRTDDATADALLSSLAVHDRVRIDVGNDAQLRYSAGVDAPSAPVEGVTGEAPDDDARGTNARGSR